tara:strand:+ start:344 stop:1507 length:1164 start_codon:yes stop_codon:yes gene_type:complete
MPDHFRNFSEGYNEWLDRAEVHEEYLRGRMSEANFFRWREKKGISGPLDIAPVWNGKGVLNIPTDQFKVFNNIWNHNLLIASSLRKAFKFQMDSKICGDVLKKNWEEFPVSLPFDRVFLDIKNERAPNEQGIKEILFFLKKEEPMQKKEIENLINGFVDEFEVLSQDYVRDELEKKAPFWSKPFIKMNVAIRTTSKERNRKLLFYPMYGVMPQEQEVLSLDDFKLEWHPISPELTDMDEYLSDYPKKEENNKIAYLLKGMLFCFFKTLYLKQQGQAMQTTHGFKKPSEVTVRPPKKRKKHPLYEYHLLEIKPQVATRSEPGIGDEPNGTRQRRHMVRGFYRTYKRPIRSGPNVGKTRVFVQSHARGDESLGYVKKDYVFANDENVVD